jgi:hypothetical protein
MLLEEAQRLKEQEVKEVDNKSKKDLETAYSREKQALVSLRNYLVNKLSKIAALDILEDTIIV